MSDTDFQKNIERLQQTLKDAKRLKKELAAQIKEIDTMVEKSKSARLKREKPVR